MTIPFNVVVYVIGLIFGVGLPFIFYYSYNKKSQKTKFIIVLIIAVINLIQHLFKHLIWPQYYGRGFSFLNTAENMCALLIMAYPFIYISKNNLLKNYLTYMCAFGGIIAIIVPIWFFGKSVYIFELIRFYVCHGLLFAMGVLPPMFKLYKLEFKHFWKIGLIFFIFLGGLILNGIIYYGNSLESLNKYFSTANPLYAMYPPKNLPFIETLVRYLSPSWFLGSNGVGYTPILWYALPMYVFITLLAFIIGIIVDKNGYKEYVTNVKSKFKKGERNEN